MAGTDGPDFEWPDIVVLVSYFVVVLAVGVWASCRASTDSAVGYFLAGRQMHWIPIGSSTFMSNVSAGMFVGLAGSAAATGMAVTMFEWHAMFMLLLLGWVFLPVYIASGCYTMPQYLKLRFGGKRIGTWLAFIYTIVTIISSIAGQMYAGTVFIKEIFGWQVYPSIIFILGITCLFTILGGLSAVIWTDTIQAVILLVGGFTVAGLAMNEMGFDSMRNQYMKAVANNTFLDAALYGNGSCGFPPDNAWHIFRPANAGDYPWPGMVFGLTILALNAWCIDQTLVQRTLSAKNMSHAKAGVTLAAYLKILSFVFFVIPGLISRVLYPQEVACADPVTCKDVCDNAAGCYDIAYALLVRRLLPVGVRGLMMAALLSALISSLTSIFNSSSTVFTMDFWSLIRPRASEGEMMVVGRVWSLVLAVVGTLWLPILEAVKGSNFWAYIQSISSFLNPPIVVSFLIGLLWKRATEQGVFWGLVVGLMVGVIRMGLEWSHTAPACGSGEPDERFVIVKDIHYLHFAMILAAVTAVVIVVISLFTKPRTAEELKRVTFWTRNDPLPPAKVELQEISVNSSESPKTTIKDDESKMKLYLLKWFCGVDRTQIKPDISKEEARRRQIQATDISEDPFWKKVVDVNGIICCTVCVFLHAFWA